MGGEPDQVQMGRWKNLVHPIHREGKCYLLSNQELGDPSILLKDLNILKYDCLFLLLPKTAISLSLGHTNDKIYNIRQQFHILIHKGGNLLIPFLTWLPPIIILASSSFPTLDVASTALKRD